MTIAVDFGCKVTKQTNYLNWKKVNPLYTGNLKTGTLTNSEDLDEMQHDAVFHQGLHCLLKLKQPSGTEIHHNLENSTCESLKCKMCNPVLIVSICMGNSIRIQRVKYKTHTLI